VNLKIKIPNFCQNEQKYILDILLREFLGVNFEVKTYEGDFIEITRSSYLVESSHSAKLTLDASSFHKAKQDWLQTQSMPALPLATWTPGDDGIKANLILPDVPVLYGSPGLLNNGNHIHLNLDIFGSAFFMLSRYEEVITKDRDGHGRFPAYLSHAYKNNYLNRPLVDEYVEILKKCIIMLWPDLKFKERKFSTNVSHDVDQVSRYQTRSNFYQYLRAIGGDLSRGFIKDLIYSPLSYFYNQENIPLYDPYNTFNWLMDISEENNIKSTFNFICGKSSKNNAEYHIEDNRIKNLIRKIHDRGHIIGLHPSYDCYDDPDLIKKELNQLYKVLQSLNIKQETRNSRMHYLRWKTPDTLRYLNSAGINKDSTLGYADYAGFRCGTCHSYAGYDLINRKILDIRIEPLIIMDCTLFDYMGLNYEQAYDFAIDIKRKCQKVDGQFNILWHNSYFQDPRQKTFYQSLIQN
jgi:hypothetical protein